MGDTHRREEFKVQRKKVNRAIDKKIAKHVVENGLDDEAVLLSYKEVCVMADANYGTLTNRGHPVKIDTYAGAEYLNKDGKKRQYNIKIEPETYLRNRHRLDHLEEIVEDDNWIEKVQED
jgi:hypothetical protein